jgi:hypothetical protein
MVLCLVEKETTPGLLGRLATSRSGRDAGVVYVVIASEAPGVVLVADGRSRGIARPKRKNVKHLEFGGTAPALVEKLAGGQPVTDEDIRAAISAAAPSVAAE